ncbi:phosphoribosylglycinamide formyltransferase, chloroplastic isoform X1 [Carica papaya]|uniref:phosphoribosylglycinamide formyltransferase, chloroplastic isoform X1 n=1 Tax=Carica papaya TaxID=3649 RepID=UPI000B8CDB30|nr:phosphoribosylglycinamide formyltransferase, chloroplastic isoform X1 [Carica papaya]
MEAQSLLCLRSKFIIPSVQNRPLFVFSTPDWAFCASNKSSEIPHFSLRSRSIHCLNSIKAEKPGDFVFNDNELKTEVKMKKLAVFVSGGGSNFRSLHQACLEGSIHGDVVVLVTNKGDCGGAEYARNNGIPTLLFPKVKDQPNGLSPSELVTVLRRYEIDFILLAGYLKLIPLELIRAYPKCIVNIHPSLLPAFGGKGYFGMKVHRAVIASGARYTGATIHFVDENYDTGRILAQQVVPVFATDTAEVLAARVLQEEHRLYVKVVAALCEGRIKWREDGVPIIQSKQKPNEYY